MYAACDIAQNNHPMENLTMFRIHIAAPAAATSIGVTAAAAPVATAESSDAPVYTPKQIQKAQRKAARVKKKN
jgi:hypothetical protein